MLNILMETVAANLRAMDKLTAAVGHGMAQAMHQARQEGQTVILATEEPPPTDATPEAPQSPPSPWKRSYYPIFHSNNWWGRPLYAVSFTDEHGVQHNMDYPLFKDLLDAGQVAGQLQQAYHAGLRVGSNGELPAYGDKTDGNIENHGAGERSRGCDNL